MEKGLQEQQPTRAAANNNQQQQKQSQCKAACLRRGFFFKDIYCTENSGRYTRLQNCSFNLFAIVVIRRARDRVSTVLGMYKCSSEKQVQREKHCGLHRDQHRNAY